MNKKNNLYIVANFGEIFLKGGNISFFENKLFSNFLEKIKIKKLENKITFKKKTGGAFFLKLSELIEEEEVLLIEEIVKNTPGFATYYRAYFCETNLKDIKKTAIFATEQFILKNNNFKTFGISTDKTDSGLEIKTRDVNVETGSALWNFFKENGGEKQVNLDNPDLKINIKLKQKNSFIFLDKKKAVGGLPIGSTGKTMAMFSGGIDSPVAAYLAMKRGLEVVAVHFHSVPQTKPESIEKVKNLLKVLKKFQPKIDLILVPIIPIQKDIVKNADRKLSIILQRRAFLKLGMELSKNDKKIVSFVTGDSLGQVASQTLENIIATSQVLDNKNRVILRPVLTYDKKEIMDLARKIGTLKISELPHEDTCSLFVPKNPETKASLSKVIEEEGKTDEEIFKKVLLKSEIIKI